MSAHAVARMRVRLVFVMMSTEMSCFARSAVYDVNRVRYEEALNVDILAHALYGATLCSRTGLGGGRRGAALSRGSFARDWTVWAAAGFGVLPDMTSIGISFVQMAIRGDSPSFHSIPPYVFVLYHCTHSLAIAGVLVLVLLAVARPLAIPALAWPIHCLMDSVSHGDGRWQTLLLYPVSDWHYPGLNWWQHPGMILLYWGILPVLWIGIHGWRRRSPPGRPEGVGMVNKEAVK